MFTGIISAKGTISSLKEINGGRELAIISPGFFKDSKLGDSVALNGICLTVTAFTSDEATFFAQIETIDKTTLSIWKIGDVVNLEHPLRLSDGLGGHLVQGHIDDTGSITSIAELEDGSVRMSFSIPENLRKYIAEKGSVCINGVSLTVASRGGEHFDVALIPSTLENTTFGSSVVGDKVNVEIDCIARYVEQLFPR